MPVDNIIQIEDPSIYDGWCVEFNTITKEFTWRKAWFTENLSEAFRKRWEDDVRKANPQLFE